MNLVYRKMPMSGRAVHKEP